MNPADRQARDVFAPLFTDEQENSQRWSEPPAISPERILTDYDRARRETVLDPISAFTPDGTPQLSPPRVLKLDLSIARTLAPFEISGNVLWYQRSTNISDLVTVRYDTQDADGVDWQPGNGIGGYPFTRLWITNGVQAGAFAHLIVMSIPGQKLLLM